MGWVHIKDTRPIARKPYQCFLCCGVIDAGEKHVHRVGRRDGDLMPFRMHEDCQAETKRWDEMDWECFSEGSMTRPTATTGATQ